MAWKRPPNVDFPKIWSKFRDEKSEHNFVIKDLSSVYYDISLGYLTNMFLRESAICKPLNILEDPTSRRQMQEKWLRIMRSDMSLICVTDDDDYLPRVAGIHLTAIKEKNINNQRKCNSSLNKYDEFTEVVESLLEEAKLFEKFNSNCYLTSLGLFVLPEFRGSGIATEFLKVRISMCREFSLKGTCSVFSTEGARRAASKAGYDVIASRKCDMFGINQVLVAMGMNVD